MSTEQSLDTISEMTATAKRFIQRSSSSLGKALVVVGTLPYYRFFHFNTLGIINRIAKYRNSPRDFDVLLRLLVRWRERKVAELQFISIACAVLAGAVIGSFSWNNAIEAYWLALACWYCSLVLSILGILLAAQQIAVLNFLGHIPNKPGTRAARAAVDRYIPLMISSQNAQKSSPQETPGSWKHYVWQPKKMMLFAWQCPIMFMSYSVCFFLVGLTLLVLTPLIRIHEKGWTTDASIAMFYLVVAAVAGSAYIVCSYWMYRYVDAETDLDFEFSDQVPQTIHPLALTAVDEQFGSNSAHAIT